MNSERPKRGLAALSPERRREIAKQGGKAAWTKGVARHFTREEAQVARLKGLITRRARKPL